MAIALARGVAQTLGGLSARLAWLERMICRALIVVFTALLAVNVTLRYGFSSPLYFAEEVAVYILIWMAFLAISVSLHENTQIRLTILVDMFDRRSRLLTLAAMDLLVAVMLTVILVHAIGWITSPAVDYELAITLGISKVPFFAIIPIFCATGLFHTLARLAVRAGGEH
ncbi:MAG: TRAP transporter small permease [Rhodospirillum sp.]|nr:TRAP transporter small permease [Rhodospirillum sp.]MCF8489768.1 TRAP transporter small permease [Rhodospirillum sp.]MCF8501267.1 TRAP transporter small permease [Rhodospirillum sp.]